MAGQRLRTDRGEGVSSEGANGAVREDRTSVGERLRERSGLGADGGADGGLQRGLDRGSDGRLQFDG